MADTTVKKVDSRFSPEGEMGQKYLVSGKQMQLRLWENEQPGPRKPPRVRTYETAGFVISGKAELLTEGQTVTLCPGDSWVVPPGASHSYRVLEPFSAVEATCPPAGMDDRDEPPSC